MDEFQSRKMLRRLALLAGTNSVAISAVASEPQHVVHQGPAAQQQALALQPGDRPRCLLSRRCESVDRDCVSKQPPVAEGRNAVEEKTKSASRAKPAPTQQVETHPVPTPRQTSCTSTAQRLYTVEQVIAKPLDTSSEVTAKTPPSNWLSLQR